MNKKKKTIILAATAVIAAGCMMILLGFVMIGFRVENLNTSHYEKKTYPVHESFKSIDIRDTEYTIRFVHAADDQCSVTVNDSDSILHTVEVENDTLKITRTDTRPWYQRVGIYIGIYEEFVVTVYLPDSAYETLYIKSVSGDVEIPAGFTFTTAQLTSTSGNVSFAGDVETFCTAKSTSGDIRLSSLTDGEITVSSTSGNVKLSDLSCRKIKATSTSGDVRLSDLQSADLSAKTTSGNVSLSSVTTSGHAELEAVSGDVELIQADLYSLRIKTVSGNVSGTLMGSYQFSTHTTSGDVRVPASDSRGGACEITTTSGDIKIEAAG